MNRGVDFHRDLMKEMAPYLASMRAPPPEILCNLVHRRRLFKCFPDLLFECSLNFVGLILQKGEKAMVVGGWRQRR